MKQNFYFLIMRVYGPYNKRTDLRCVNNVTAISWQNLFFIRVFLIKPLVGFCRIIFAIYLQRNKMVLKVRRQFKQVFGIPKLSVRLYNQAAHLILDKSKDSKAVEHYHNYRP